MRKRKKKEEARNTRERIERTKASERTTSLRKPIPGGEDTPEEDIGLPEFPIASKRGGRMDEDDSEEEEKDGEERGNKEGKGRSSYPTS